MFEIFREEKWITIIMLSFFGFSIAVRMILGILYKQLIKETDNMAVTKSMLLKQCKLKFINCYQLNNGVSNIPVFVDKFMGRMSVGPFTFDKLYHFSGQTMLLSVAAAGVAVCKGIMERRALGEILPFYYACFAALYLYCSLSSAVDISGKRKMLKVSLVDYLENHLAARITVTGKDLEMLHYVKPGKKAVELMPMGKRLEVISPEREEVSEDGMAEKADAASEEITQPDTSQADTDKELQALLKEFLAI